MGLRDIFLPPLVEHNGGLYRAGQRRLNVTKAAVLAAAGVGVIAFGQLYIMGCVYLAIAGWLGWREWADYRAFGDAGRPLVRIQEGAAFFALPSRLIPKHVDVPLREVKALNVLGDALRRNFVFERRHGESIRFDISYGRHDSRVLEFVQRQMPARIPVTIKEPPAASGSLHGSAR